MSGAVRAEFLKMATLPRLWLPVLVAVVAGPLAALATAGRASSSDSLVRVAGGAALITLVVLVVWAGLVSTSEFQSGAIVSTLPAVGRRAHYFAARLVAAAAVAVAASTVSVVLAVAAAESAASTGHPVGNVWALVGVVGVITVSTMAAAAAGLLLRGGFITLAAVLAALIGPKLLGGLLGRAEPWVVGSSPNALVSRLAGNCDLPASQISPAGTAGAVVGLALGLIVVAGAGWVAFSRAEF